MFSLLFISVPYIYVHCITDFPSQMRPKFDRFKPVQLFEISVETSFEFCVVSRITAFAPLRQSPLNFRFDRMSNSSLHISFLRLEDSGVFQCSASNDAGDVVGYTWLKVRSEYFRRASLPANNDAQAEIGKKICVFVIVSQMFSFS